VICGRQLGSPKASCSALAVISLMRHSDARSQ
jgi:hypothetical protein